MFTSVVLIGRAGAAPEVKTFNSGNKLAVVNMAVTRPVKGQKEPTTDWFSVKIWGASADVAEQYIKKGDVFAVQGELQQEKWESNGEKRSKVVIHCHKLKLMPNPKKQEDDIDDISDLFVGEEEENPFA